jgi:hypothetical protein
MAEEYQGIPPDENRPHDNARREGQRRANRPHEELVRAFRGLIRERQQEIVNWGGWPPAMIIRGALKEQASLHMSPDPLVKQRAQFYGQIQKAWDVIAYEQYEWGYHWSDHDPLYSAYEAGFTLFDTYKRARDRQEPRPEFIKLDPQQAKILDALAEAADVPHQRGQTEIEIPEHLREHKGNYEDWLRSEKERRRGKQSANSREHEAASAQESRETTVPRNARLTPTLAEKLASLQEAVADMTNAVWELRGGKPAPSARQQEAERPNSGPGPNQAEGHQSQPESAKTTLSRVMQERVFDKLGTPEPGEHWPGQDPLYRPSYLMDHLRYELSMQAYREGRVQVGEKLPVAQSLEKVRMAYDIIAYPRLDNAELKLEVKSVIADAVENPDMRTDDFPHRGPIALTDEEVRMLSKLAQAMALPFDPDKRVYRYTELQPLREAESIVFSQSPLYKQFVQNAIDAGILRKREDIEEEIRKRQEPWRDEGSEKPPGSNPPQPEK